jgi:hypothetical protein
MSTLGPDPSEGSGVPPKDNTAPGGKDTTAEETTVTPAADGQEETAAPAADADYAWGPPTVRQPTVAETTEQPVLNEDTAVPLAAEEPPGAEEPPRAEEPPAAELLVTPAAPELAHGPVPEEAADAPVAEEPADIPAADEPAGAPGLGAPSAPSAPMPALTELARKPTLGQAIVMVTGVLLFVWGFLPWYSDAGGSANAWSTETIPGLLLTATWVPLLSLAIAIFVAIKVFANGFPDRVFGFTWPQLSMVVGLIGVLISLGFLVANRSLGNLGSLSLGIGLILSFITSLVLLAGGVLDHLGVGTDSLNRSGRPARPGRL